MSLYLIELIIDGNGRDAATATLERVADAAARTGAEVLEANVTRDHARAFVVLASDAHEVAAATARQSGLRHTDPDEVRLVGATIDEVRGSRERAAARYLVEWDFPPDLTMDGYLARKQETTRLYQQVPEVSFLRTYVREDMQKCLCLYDASDEQDLRRARQAVSTPITRVHTLDETRSGGDAG